jgi:hypothetical protein
MDDRPSEKHLLEMDNIILNLAATFMDKYIPFVAKYKKI